MEQHRMLGKSDVRVSPVVFGAWAIGGWMWGGNDDQEALGAIAASIDHGVNTIDTAAIYGMGHSEELVGRAIAGRRDQVCILTKCGMRWDTEQGSDPWPQKDNAGKEVVIRKNAHPQSIQWECEQSLKRLKIDMIDLYQIHWPDVSCRPEESIAAMEKLRQQGKVRAIGVCNYDVQWLQRASSVATVASNQPPYSLLQRNIEKEILPWCREHEVGVIVYSPMERGLLTGKVTEDREFAPGDHRAKHKYFTKENRRRVLDALEKIRCVTEAHNASFAQVVVNWTIQQPGITAALVGARNAEQAAQNAGAMSFTLSAQERAAIRAAFDESARVMNQA